ncbi:MAG: type II CAAX endopeptidase family protein [Mesorhizobium sp.]
MHSPAFEAYRSSPPQRVSLWRLLFGIIIIGLCWLGTSLLAGLPALLDPTADPLAFFSSKIGTLATLGSFLGIWIGVWIATRFVHRERFSNVLGADRRINFSDFAKGLLAVLLTSVLSEILIYVLNPQFERTALDIGTWLVFIVPILLLCFVQTSAEELLFRGYLPRNLANRFRSPLIWAVLPSIVFVCLHLTSQMSASQLVLVLISIGTLTVLLMFLVWLTGNLGAAFGVHMGNNLFGFALVAHQDEFAGLALFRGVPINDPIMGNDFAFALGAVGVICVGITAALLLHSRSPLKVDVSST